MGNRARKTDEKLASYKAAARNSRTRQNYNEGGRQGSVLASPRRRRNDDEDTAGSVRVSPRRKRNDDQDTTADLPASDTCQGKSGSSQKGTGKSSRREKGGPNRQSVREVDNEPSTAFDSLERIPETPPRSTPSAGRGGRGKRVHPLPPLYPDSDSGDESDKPSKKRKTFTTPPRVVANNTNQDQDESPQTTKSSGPKNDRGVVVRGNDDENCRGITEGETIVALENSNVSDDRTERKSGSSFPRVSQRAWDNGYRPRSIREDTGNAERSALQAEDLEVLHLSSATLSRILDGYGSKLVAEVNRMQRENAAEIRKIADGVLASLSSEMRHMEGIFTMITRGIGGTRSGKNGAKTSLTDWEQKLNSLTPDTDVIFNKEMLGMFLCYNKPIQATSIYRKKEGSDLARAALSAQTLLFSLQPGDKKYSYSGKVGGLHSEFKFTIVQNTFFNVLRDTFMMFRMSENHGDNRKENASVASAVSSGSVSNTGEPVSTGRLIKRPSWLEQKVTKDHINDARNFLERPNQSRKSKVRSTPSPYDVACHGALRVYRLLGSYLHVRRGAVRATFFQSIGYLLVPWHEHVKDVKQNTLKMSCSPGGDDSPMLNLADVPCSEQSGFVADHSAVTSIDSNNKKLLAQLFSDWPGMALSVQHEVYVVNGNGVQRKHSGGEPMVIRRFFNMIDVACDFCDDYCGTGTREKFLRGHKYSLRCIMMFAMLFKEFCIQFMRHCDIMESSAAENVTSGRNKYPHPSELEVEGLFLKELIPGPSAQRNLLECRCLRMTRS